MDTYKVIKFATGIDIGLLLQYFFMKLFEKIIQKMKKNEYFNIKEEPLFLTLGMMVYLTIISVIFVVLHLLDII